jgi:hypothetical protein
LRLGKLDGHAVPFEHIHGRQPNVGIKLIYIAGYKQANVHGVSGGRGAKGLFVWKWEG